MENLILNNKNKLKLDDLLITYYKDYHNKLLFNLIDSNYLKKVRIYSYLTTIRRITNYNSLIFKINNNKFVDVKDYVKKIVFYYVNYYIKFIGLYKKE